jgi:GT2 family glycosyltransferase/ADP-heptose:LPS heptosyltransferase
VKFDIVVVVHNCLDEFEACLVSVEKLDQDKHQFELFVWDNNSDDFERLDAMLGLTCAPVHDFKHPQNAGFSYPADTLARDGDGDIILFLNPDATLPPNALTVMAQPFEDYERVAAVGPRGGCRTILQDGVGAPRAPMDYIEGACLAVRRPLYLAVGGFDHEHYRFAYCEDADLSLKLRRRGYELAEVDLPGYEHGRASTTDLVRKQGTVDVDGYRVINQLRLRSRWAEYMSRWTFKRTLVLTRNAAIGDCLQLTALAEAVAEAEPEWALYADTPWPGLFANNPSIRAWDGRANERVECLSLDGAYERRPDVHIVDGYLWALGIEPKLPPPQPRLYLAEEEVANAMALVPSREPFAVMHAEPTNWPGRDWPTERFNEVAEALDMPVLQVGAEANPETAVYHALDMRGLELRMSMALISKASLFLGIDSFPATVAAACDVPSVVLFGCVRPSLRLSGKAMGLTGHGLSCLGCHHEHPPPVVFSSCQREPEAKYAPCMRAISADDVFVVASVLLDGE